MVNAGFLNLRSWPGWSGTSGLSDYELSVKDGQFDLCFKGLWTETTMWELYALAIIDELKTRANLKKLSEFGLDILYARAKTKLWGKIEQLVGVPELHVADFGTRRRHSFLWQEYVVEAMASNLGSAFTGTSKRLSSPTSTIWRRSGPTRTKSPWSWLRLHPTIRP
jgi:nicotinic acid phosphoribosyltransferase